MTLFEKTVEFSNAKWNILCDFDGTITSVDVIDTLLEVFADSVWNDIEKDWEAGLIGSFDCLSKQIGLLNMSREQLDRHLDNIEIDPFFPQFVTQAQEKGHTITILSDGIDYAIKRILSRYDLAYLPMIANRLKQNNDSHTWGLEFPYASVDCQINSGHCKCSSLKKVTYNAQNIRHRLLIGDGTSDFCIAKKVDLVLAKKKLIKHCADNQLSHVPIKDFSEAMIFL